MLRPKSSRYRLQKSVQVFPRLGQTRRLLIRQIARAALQSRALRLGVYGPPGAARGYSGQRTFHRVLEHGLGGRRFGLVLAGAVPDIAQTAIELLGGEPVWQNREGEIAADDCAGDDHEHENRQRQHHRTSVTPSNMSAGRWIPHAFMRSQHFGLGQLSLARQAEQLLVRPRRPQEIRKPGCDGMIVQHGLAAR